jgi:hypothetical protein
MVKLIGKGHAWFLAALAALLIAALFCGCTVDADDIKAILSGIQSKGNEDPTPSVPDPDTSLNVQYIRTEFFPFAEYPNPTITIVSSKEDLEQYYEKHKQRGWDLDGNLVPDYNFLDAIEKYSDDYFAENYLVIVRIVEGSGSIRHKMEKINENGDIVINRLLPECGTCDMAAWSILIELNNNFEAEQFQVVRFDVRDY